MGIVKKIRQTLSRRSYLGVEINEIAVKISEVRSMADGSIKIEQTARAALKPQTIEDGKINDLLGLTAAMQNALAKTKFKSKDVHFALPSTIVMVRFMKLPNVPMRDLRKLVEYEVEHQIHLPFSDPFFDFVKLNGAPTPNRKKVKDMKELEVSSTENRGDFGFQEVAATQEAFDSNAGMTSPEQIGKTGANESNQCDIMLVVTSRAMIDQYVSVLQACGLKPKSIEIKGLSLLRLIEKTYAEPPKDQPFVVVDLNQVSADINVFDQGQLRLTRNVSLILPQESTDELAPPSMLFEQACAELTEEIARLMNFFRYGMNNRTKQFERVLLTGDTPQLQDVATYLQQNSTTNVEVVRSATEDDERISSFAVSVGLALRGNSV